MANNKVFDEPYQWTENGYLCVNEVTVENFYAHRKFCFRGTANSNNYNFY